MQTEQMLKASVWELANLKAALDEHAIVAITNAQGKITFVNDKFCAISQYSREELLGRDHRLINSGYHPKAFMHDLWSTITHGRVWHGEIRNRAKDGSLYWVATTIVPFLGDDGRPKQYIAIRADVTERKRAEEAVLRLNAELELRVAERTAELEQANKELEAFSYSVSHDLRAPLRALDGFSQAVLEDCEALLPPDSQRHLRTIRASAKKMGVLIDDLLAFSRLGRAPLTKQTVNTEKVVREALRELGFPWPGTKITVKLHPLPECQGDPGLLGQVWLNLLANAYKFSGRKAEPLIEIGATHDQGGTVYFVRDNGCGFDMRYAAKLFGVFQRLHRLEDYEGTGVGLAIVQRIVHRHGGRVWAEGAVDRGATFSFTLDRSSAP